ncbi:MAG: hypothetical protein KDI19_15790 [Pseudomonadales bacterium]|nr:hypothetical protein [Pseudomonadales bacterium]
MKSTSCKVGGVVRSRQARSLEIHIATLAGTGFLPIMATSVIFSAVNVYFGLFWLYMVNLFLYLLGGVEIFRNLLTHSRGERPGSGE